MNRQLGMKVLVIVCLCFILSGTVWAQQGLTETEIHLAQFGPQTGPAAPWGMVARGAGIFFNMVNESGGIHGRKIVYHLVDDGYDPVRTRTGVINLQESQGIFAWIGGVGSQTGLAVKDYLVEHGIPWVAPVSGIREWIDPPQNNIFSIYVQYQREVNALFDYAIHHLKQEKIAVVYQNDSYGRECLGGAVKSMYAQGKTLTAQVPVDFKSVDIKPQVMALQDSGAEVVMIFMTPLHAVRLLKTAIMMDFAPQWMTLSNCSDFVMMEHLGQGVFEGVIATTLVELPDSDHPLVQRYKQAFETFKSPDHLGILNLFGIGIGEVIVEALKRSGPDLSRERLISELEQLKDFKGVLGKISFAPFDPDNPDCRDGMKSLLLIQSLKGGKTKKLKDWIE